MPSTSWSAEVASRPGFYFPGKIFLVLILLFRCAFGHAQVKSPDFVLPAVGDTLHGEVKYTFYNQNENLVVSTNNGRVLLDITKVRLAAFGGHLYKTVRFHDHYTLMQIIRQGYLTKYLYRSDPASSLFNAYYIGRPDGTGMEVPNIGFRKRIAEFLSDCPAVSQGLADKKWSRNDLDAVIDAYNACIASKTTVQETDTWTSFGANLKAAKDFDGKRDAMDILDEIQSKLMNHQPVPDFLYRSMESTLKSEPGLLAQFKRLEP